MAQDPWADFPVANPAPRAQPSAPRAPAPPPYIAPVPNPTKQAQEDRAQRGEQRDEASFGIKVDEYNRGKDKTRFEQEAKLRDDFNQNPQVKGYRNSLPMLSTALRAPKNGQGDLTVIYAYAKLMDPESVVREGEMDMVNSSSPWAQAKAQQLQNQLDSSGRLPEATRRGLEQEMIRTTQARRKAYESQYGDYSKRAQQYGLDPFMVVGEHAGEGFRADMQGYDKARGLGRFAEGPEASPTSSGNLNGPRNDGPGLPPAADGSYPTPQSHPDGYVGIDPVTGDEVIVGWSDQTIARYKEIERINNQRNFMAGAVDGMGGNAMIERAKYGALLGFGDEVAGFGGALAGVLTGKDPVEQYNLYRDADLVRQRQFQEAQGVTGSVAEFLGAGATTLAIPGATSGTIRGAAKAGGITGGIQGAGDARTYRDVVPNAMIGAAGGAVIGGGLQGGFNAAAPLVRRVAARAPQPIANADEVVAAGQAEGIDVNRAMIDPAMQNRVTGVDASMAGGPRFQRGIGEIEGQFENRVQALGQGGTPMNRQAQGQTILQAGERYIKASGRRARDQYDAAAKMAGDAKVAPKESLALLDEVIGRIGGKQNTGLLDADGNPILRAVDGAGLSETPKINAEEINFLAKLKSDLSNDLSVQGLRKMRTSLRQKISKGDLVFGEDEKTVLDVMDAAARDIESGLVQQGKTSAAKAFREADANYRDRMEYINGTLQKIIGKRNANYSAERVADNLSAMARGKDEMGVKKFMDTLDPTERADVAATFADALGKNAKEQFTVTQFLRQTTDKNFPEGALRVVFGDEGAASIKRLRVLGPEIERVTSAMNSRKSGTGVANDYRTWLFSLVLGGGGAVVNSPGMIAAGVATAGIKGARDVLGARALLSKDISKWLVNAPRTTNPKAIDRHVSQLSAVAGGTSPYRMEAQQLLEYLQTNARQAANTSAAAASSEENK